MIRYSAGQNVRWMRRTGGQQLLGKPARDFVENLSYQAFRLVGLKS